MIKIPFLHILQDAWWNFSKIYRRVYEYLIWMFRSCDKVFPSKDRIAFNAKCSVRQVHNALTCFRTLGLIGWMNRGSKSNVYFFDEEMRNIDLKKIYQAKRPIEGNCRSNCRLANGVPDIDIHVHKPTTSDVPKSTEKRKQEQPLSFEDLPHMLKQPFMQVFDYDNYGWQLKLLPEVGQQEIIEDLRWYALEQAKQGKPIKDMVTWCKIFTWKMKKWIFKQEKQEEVYAI